MPLHDQEDSELFQELYCWKDRNSHLKLSSWDSGSCNGLCCYKWYQGWGINDTFRPSLIVGGHQQLNSDYLNIVIIKAPQGAHLRVVCINVKSPFPVYFFLNPWLNLWQRCFFSMGSFSVRIFQLCRYSSCFLSSSSSLQLALFQALRLKLSYGHVVRRRTLSNLAWRDSFLCRVRTVGGCRQSDTQKQRMQCGGDKLPQAQKHTQVFFVILQSLTLYNDGIICFVLGHTHTQPSSSVPCRSTIVSRPQSLAGRH